MLAKTAQLWAFGVLKAPLIFFLRPRMVELSPERAAVKLRLSRRTKNQGGSMYFGALMSGADMVPGILATAIGQRLHREVSFAVKDCQARFLRRAGGDVTFVCEDAGEIERAIVTAAETSARQSVPVKVAAMVGLARVADFALTFSLKAA